MSTTHVVMNISNGHVNQMEFLMASSDETVVLLALRIIGTSITSFVSGSCLIMS